MSLYIFEGRNTIVYLYIQHYMFNYSLYIIIINRNVLVQFNAIVTRMNKYIIIVNLLLK